MASSAFSTRFRRGIGRVVRGRPRSVVYASRVNGVVGDGVHDDTSAINAALAGGNIEFVQDVPSLINGGLVVYSSTGLRCQGAGRLVQRANGSGYPMIRNANPTVSGTTPQDRHIYIVRPNIDHNRRNAGAGNTDPDNPQASADGYQVPAIALYGVDGFGITDAYMFDPCSYGVHLANAWNGTVRGCRAVRYPGDTRGQNACVQMQGGCKNLVLINLSGDLNDDLVALCANDGNDLPSPPTTYRPGTVHYGPISGIYGSGFYTDRAGSLIRFLSARADAPITDCQFFGLSGTVLGRGVHFDTFGVPGDGSYGWYDGIEFTGVQIRGGSPVDLQSAAVFIHRAQVGRIEFHGLDTRGFVGLGGRIRETASAKGRRVYVPGFAAPDWSTAPQALPGGAAAPVVLEGAIREFILPEPDLGADAPTTGPAVLVTPSSLGVGTRVVRVTGGSVKNFETAVKVAWGASAAPVPSAVGVQGVRLSTPDGVLVASDDALPRVIVDGDADFYTDLPAGSNAKNDGRAWLQTANGTPAGVVESFTQFVGRVFSDVAGATQAIANGVVRNETGRFTGATLVSSSSGTSPLYTIDPVTGWPYLLCNGASAQKISGAVTGLPLGTAARTLEAWLLPTVTDPGGYSSAVSYGVAANGLFCGFGLATGPRVVFTQAGPGLLDTTIRPLNEWLHVAVTYDDSVGANGTWTLYVNGVAVGSSASLATATAAGDFYLGSDVAGSNYTGGVRAARVWSVLLTAAQVRDRYLRGLSS